MQVVNEIMQYTYTKKCFDALPCMLSEYILYDTCCLCPRNFKHAMTKALGVLLTHWLQTSHATIVSTILRQLHIGYVITDDTRTSSKLFMLHVCISLTGEEAYTDTLHSCKCYHSI